MKKLLIPLVVGVVVGLGGSTAAVAMLGRDAKPLTESLAEHSGEAVDGVADVAEGEGVEGESAPAALAVADSLPAEGGGEGVEGEVETAGLAETLAFASSAFREVAVVTPATDRGPAGSGLSAPAPSAGGVGGLPASAALTGPQGGMETERMAKLFGSMQPRDAARVLEHMDDFEVQVILNQLGNREAAAILGNLSPERAAVITRSVIRGGRSTP